MSDDAELLRRYAADRSEAAFTELVRRHVDLVYSAALRLVSGDVHRAQDVTQQVFVELARQAQRLTTHPALAGWLYTVTRLMARRTTRTEQRRAAREQEAHTMNELLRDSAPEESWNHLRPVLDDAMYGLSEKDRLAVLLRFFQNKNLKEVGVALDLNENAARMRVDRALEKLRTQLVRRGVTSTTSALAVALTGNAISAAPATFVATLASASLASVVVTGTSLTLFELLTMAKLKTGVVSAIVIASIATPFVLQHQTQVQLREENAALRQQVEEFSKRIAQTDGSRTPAMNRSLVPRLPAPHFQMATALAEPPPQAASSTNVIARLTRGGDAPKLTAVQADTYLRGNGRNAATLLAAFRTTGDPAFLEEAMQRHPDDPQVGFEAVFKKDITPEQRRQWLDSFKQSAPDNALANYLSALDRFKSGQPDEAVQELISAKGKNAFEDYTLDRVQNDEEAYLAAGYSVAEAKTISSFQLLLPQLKQMKELNENMVALADSYRQAGDEASAQAVLQMSASLGQRYSITTPGESEISQLVGMAIERIALRKMDPGSPYGNNGQSVQDRLNQLAQQNAALKELNQKLEPLMPTLTDQDWINYKDRWRIFGEEAAIRWVITKYGQK